MAEEHTRSDFVRKVQELLIKGDSQEALYIIIKDNTYNSEVDNHLWDIIPVFTQFLNDEQVKINWNRFQHCVEFVNIIAENAIPEVVILQFLEEIEEAEDDIKYFSMLKPVQKVLLRIPEKQQLNSLSWCFNSINLYLNKSKIPDNVNLRGKEKLSLDANEDVLKIVMQYEETLFFYDELIEALKNIVTEEGKDQALIIQKFLIQLLGKPFVYLDLEIFDDIKRNGRTIAEKIVGKLFSINSDPFLALVTCNDSKCSAIFKPDSIGFAVLFYLVYTESVCNELVPKVYCPFYFFQNSLHLVTALLHIDHQIVIEKGLQLGKNLLERIRHEKLSYLMLESEDHSRFCKVLVKIILHNQDRIIRSAALNIYKNYLLAFETRGFYLLLYNLLPRLGHCGLIGYTAVLYKDYLANEFSQNSTDISPYFRGAKQLKLLNKLCYFQTEESNDMVECSDQIISCLNLLRYIILRDKDNVTGIWNNISELEQNFLEPVRKGLDVSRGHVKQKLQELLDEKASRDKKKSDTNISVTVDGENLEHGITLDQRIQVMGLCLNTFSVIESVLTRLNECINLNRQT